MKYKLQNQALLRPDGQLSPSPIFRERQPDRPPGPRELECIARTWNNAGHPLYEALKAAGAARRAVDEYRTRNQK